MLGLINSDGRLWLFPFAIDWDITLFMLGIIPSFMRQQNVGSIHIKSPAFTYYFSPVRDDPVVQRIFLGTIRFFSNESLVSKIQ